MCRCVTAMTHERLVPAFPLSPPHLGSMWSLPTAPSHGSTMCSHTCAAIAVPIHAGHTLRRLCVAHAASGNKGFGAQRPARQSAWERLVTELEPMSMASGHGQPAWLLQENMQPLLAPGIAAIGAEDTGRGLTAQHPLACGDIILISPPLLSTTGGPGVTPPPSHLVPPLTKSVFHCGLLPSAVHETAASNPTQHNLWLQAFWQLYGGSQEPGALPDSLAVALAALQQTDLQQVLSIMLHVPQLRPAATSNTDPAPTVSPQLRLAVQQAAARRAQLNGYGEPHQDVVVHTLRTKQQRAKDTEATRVPYQSCVGVWPAMALINHSCAPNASTMLVDGHMLVRAARDIEAGEDITISYAGVHASSPVAVRRQALREGFGFRCDCARCLAEQDYEDEPVGRLAQSMYKSLSGQLRTSLLATLDTEDPDALDRIRRKLQRHRAEYEDALTSMEDPEDRAVLACASLPLCLELLSMTYAVADPVPVPVSRAPAAPAGAGPATAGSSGGRGGGRGQGRSQPAQRQAGTKAAQPDEALQLRRQRIQALRTIAPGSYAEAELSARLVMDSCRQLGVGHRFTQDAWQGCMQAHTARYGSITDQSTLVAVLEAHGRNALADDMARAVAAYT